MIKRKVLGTTAMVASTLLFAVGTAQGANKIKLGVGGYFNAFLVYVDQDDGVGEPGANLRKHKISREGEIHFEGKTTLDNGLKFGVSVQLEAETCTDQIDESYMWIEGSFGRVVVGAKDPAPDAMFYGSPAAIPGIGLASPDAVFTTLGNGAATPAVITNISGDSEKVTYFTPRMSGFQLGLSYTPENCEETTAGTNCTGTYGGMQGDSTAGQLSEIVEFGANYLRQIGSVDVALYAGYAAADLEAPLAGADDQEQWGVGVQLAFGDFTLGADYREDDQGTSGSNTDRTDYSIGVNYAMGQWTLGAAFAHGEAGAGAGLGDDETDGYQVGAAFDLGPGIVLTGGITFWNVEDNLNAVGVENNGTELVIGTLLSF